MKTLQTIHLAISERLAIEPAGKYLKENYQGRGHSMNREDIIDYWLEKATFLKNKLADGLRLNHE